MPRKKKAAADNTSAPGNQLYKVQLKTDDDCVILKHSMLVVRDGWVVVNKDELDELKGMGVV